MRRCDHAFRFWLLLTLTIVFTAARPHNARAAAIDDIQVSVSANACDVIFAGPKSFIVAAQNKNSSQSISATFQYDSVPSSQSFLLFDANLAPYTDRFPKSLTIRIDPGATVPIGCTYNYRSSSSAAPTTVPITFTVVGAAYVNPGQPNPPEDARAFTAFFISGGFPSCESGARTAGEFFIVNLHPYARLTTTIDLLNPVYQTPDQMKIDIPPLATTRVGCTNGPESPKGIATAQLTYPPEYQKQR
jgi:hypothetical protein